MFVTQTLKGRLTLTTGTEAFNWAELIQLARDGNDQALNEIWHQLRSYLLMFAGQRLDAGLTKKLDASDIVQQSLMEAHRDFSKFRGHSEGELRSWVSQLVLHNLLDANRKFRQSQKRCVTKEVAWDSSSDLSAGREQTTASSIVRRRETDDELMRAIALLPERSQQILELRHRLGLSHAQVAQELGMTEAAARKGWSRIIEELQSKLSPENIKMETK